MKLGIELRPTRWDAPLWPAAIVLVWISLVATALLVRPAAGMPGLCLFHNVTGVPCPTCGGTRMMLALGHGDILSALKWNPLLMVALTVGGAWLLARIALRRRITVSCSESQRRAMWCIAAILLAANWAWLIARAT